jgi:hypothetical protein
VEEVPYMVYIDPLVKIQESVKKTHAEYTPSQRISGTVDNYAAFASNRMVNKVIKN